MSHSPPKDLLAKISPMALNLFSGISISASINLYTSVMGSDILPVRWLIVLTSASLWLVSACLFAILSWKLDTLQKLAFFESPTDIDPNKIWDAIVRNKRWKLKMYLWGGISSAIFGLVVLLIQTKLPVTQQDEKKIELKIDQDK